MHCGIYKANSNVTSGDNCGAVSRSRCLQHELKNVKSSDNISAEASIQHPEEWKMAAVNLSNHMWISCHRTNVLWQDTAEAVSRAAHVDLPPPFPPCPHAWLVCMLKACGLQACLQSLAVAANPSSLPPSHLLSQHDPAWSPGSVVTPQIYRGPINPPMLLGQ